jgi:uncharacterized SAM-binding protein YcdF (DUF218 family)
MFLTTPRWWLPLFMPSTVSLVLIVAGLVLLCRRRERWRSRSWHAGMLSCVTGVSVLYLSCTPLVATWLASRLERLTPALRPADAPRCDAVVVLGGSFRWHRDEAREPLRLSATTERLQVAVEAYRLGKAPYIVVGGGGKPDDPAVCEGEFQKRQAEFFGVPADAIIAVPTVTNTESEAQEDAVALRALHAKKILLATSVWHLPRAMIQFRAQGFEVVGLPCHYLTAGHEERFDWRQLLPRGMALEQTENCVKEALGLLSATLFPPRDAAAGSSP